jgi:hypothetical protein
MVFQLGLFARDSGCLFHACGFRQFQVPTDDRVLLRSEDAGAADANPAPSAFGVLQRALLTKTARTGFCLNPD